MEIQSQQSESDNEFKQMAESFVSKSQLDPYIGGFGVVLNYSPASVAALDEFLREIYGTEGAAPGGQQYQLPDGKAALLMGLGAYVGETVRAMIGGYWQKDTAQPRNIFAVKVVFGAEEHIAPFNLVWLRFKEGSSEDLFPAIYQIAHLKSPEKRAQHADEFLVQAAAFERNSPLAAEAKAQLVHFFTVMADGMRTGGLASPDWDPNAARPDSSNGLETAPQTNTEPAAAAMFEFAESAPRPAAAPAVARPTFEPGELNGHSAAEQQEAAAVELKNNSLGNAVAATQQRIQQENAARRSRSRRLSLGCGCVLGTIVLHFMLSLSLFSSVIVLGAALAFVAFRPQAS